MTYRRTAKYTAARQRAMQASRMAREVAYPSDLPDLRLRIIIERLDFGCERHVIELHKTPRVDQYRAVVDGQPWRDRIGLARVLAGIRKGLPRVRSPRSL